MSIFTRYNECDEQGFTLFELLVVLSILSMTALISASAFSSFYPRIAVDQAAEQLVADLKRARLHAYEYGKRVSIRPSERGYDIPAINLRRVTRNDLDLTWSGTAESDVFFSHRFANLGGRIEILKGDRRAVVLVHAITGKVERIE